jgi:type IV secretory pathway VirB6-like protein
MLASRSFLTRAIVAVAWLSLTSLAFAQTDMSVLGAPNPAAAPGSGGGLESLRSIGGYIQQVIGIDLMARFLATALGISTTLMPAALVIGGALALATILWQVMVAMINKDSAMTAATEALLYASLAAALLTMYRSIVQDIVGLGTFIAGRVGSGGGNALGSAAQGFIEAYLAKFVDIVVKSTENVSGVVSFFTSGIDMLASFFFMLIACWFAFGALIELIGVVIMGPLVVGIGVALGPLFVSTLASHWTRRWFDQWFNFLLNGAILTAIVVVVLTLLTGVIAATVGVGTGGFQTGEALGLALISAGMGKVFSSIPSFADALLPGRTSAGSALNSGKSSSPVPASKTVASAAAGSAAPAAGAVAGASPLAGFAAMGSKVSPVAGLSSMMAKAAQVAGGGTGINGAAGMTGRAAGILGSAATAGAPAAGSAVASAFQGGQSLAGQAIARIRAALAKTP